MLEKQENMKNKQTNLKECYCSGVKPALAYEYVFYTNENKHVTDQKIVTGDYLHELEGTNPDTHFIRKKTKRGKELVGSKVEVDLTECGIERFIIRPYKQEIIDLEDCFCEGTNPIITYKYLIKVNRVKYETDKDEISREEIFKLVGKDPSKHRLRMFTKDGKVIIKEGQIIDLTKCGVERFVYEALDCTEGFITEEPSILPKEDIYFLASIENTVDYLEEGSLSWVVFRDLEIPKGYNVSKADAAILIPPHYPTAPLDMIYFYPALSRVDGKMIRQLSNQNIEGRIYQRWSRHRTALNKWNPEIDNLESQLDLMLSCLKAEFNKR